MSHFIPLSIPNFEGNEKKYVDDAVEQGWVSTGGAYITRLEGDLEKFLHVDSVAACQSGTSAIHLALVDCGVEPGDLVIVPTLTFIAAVNPVKYQFAEPIFMDCDESLCMDPIKLREFCANECDVIGEKLIHKTTGKPVKAIIVVHIFGNMADMESIMQIANDYHLKVIEDATEALGTYYTEGMYASKYAGTIGHYGAYSFNGNKIITTGGGGAVTSSIPGRVERLRYLSTQAKDDAYFYIHNEVGYNYRMTNIQAALGVAQMEKLQTFIDRKQRNYEYYAQLLGENKLCKLLPFRDTVSSNKWFYSVEIAMEKINADMRTIVLCLQDKGIQTRAIWGLIHKQLPYQEAFTYQIERADYFSKCILNIPCSTQITKEEIAYTVKCIGDVLGELTYE